MLKRLFIGSKFTQNLLIIIIFSPFNLLIACEKTNIEGMCQYQKHNMQFSYSGDWHISEESGWFSSPYVFLENEESDLIMLLQLDSKEYKTLSAFAKNYSNEAHSSMVMGSFSEGEFTNIKSPQGQDGLQETLEMTFMDTTLEYVRHYYLFNNDKHHVYVILQTTRDELTENLSVLHRVLQNFTLIE